MTKHLDQNYKIRLARQTKADALAYLSHAMGTVGMVGYTTDTGELFIHDGDRFSLVRNAAAIVVDMNGNVMTHNGEVVCTEVIT